MRKVWSGNESKLISNFLVWAISTWWYYLLKWGKPAKKQVWELGLVCFGSCQWSGDYMISKWRFQICIWINKSGVQQRYRDGDINVELLALNWYIKAMRDDRVNRDDSLGWFKNIMAYLRGQHLYHLSQSPCTKPFSEVNSRLSLAWCH